MCHGVLLLPSIWLCSAGDSRPKVPASINSILQHSHCPIIDCAKSPSSREMRRPRPNATPLRHCVISSMRGRQLQLHLRLVHHANLTTKLPPRFYLHRQLPFVKPTTTLRPLTTTKTMSSDNDYMAFLNKANADLDAGRSQPQHQSQARSTTVQTGTVDVNAQIPRPLASIDSYYVSETDEPFEPVVLKWEDAKRGIWPGVGMSFHLLLASCSYILCTHREGR